MNENILLFLSVANQYTACEKFGKIIEMICDNNAKSIIVEFSFEHISVTNSFIKQIIEIEKKIKGKYTFSIIYVLSCRLEQIRKLNLRLLVQKGFKIKLCFDEITQLSEAAKKLKKLSRSTPSNPKIEIYIKKFAKINNELDLDILKKIIIPLRFELPNFAEEDYINLFDKWMSSKDYADISNYSELIKLIMMNEHNDCEHNSCLGRIISVDSIGMTYWCKYNKPETAVNHIDKITSLQDCWNSKSFEKYLDAHFDKRKYCNKKCFQFFKCQSGCPLRCDFKESLKKCSEQDYLTIIDHISDKLNHTIKSGDLSLINKYARILFIDAIAFAPLSDFFSKYETNEN